MRGRVRLPFWQAGSPTASENTDGVDINGYQWLDLRRSGRRDGSTSPPTTAASTPSTTCTRPSWTTMSGFGCTCGWRARTSSSRSMAKRWSIIRCRRRRAQGASAGRGARPRRPVRPVSMECQHADVRLRRFQRQRRLGKCRTQYGKRLRGHFGLVYPRWRGRGGYRHLRLDGRSKPGP